MLIRRRAGAEPTRHFAARGVTVRFAVATSIVAAVEAETAAIVWVITNEASRRRAVGSGDAPPTKKQKLCSAGVSRNRVVTKIADAQNSLRLVERGHRTDLAVVCAMLRRPRRLRDDAKDGHAADVVFNVHVPMRKRLMFFAKIDADDVADRLSKIRLPASVVKAFQDSKIEIPDTIRKAYDDFQNPTFQPDRRRLSSVEDFFRYTEEEGA
jgi:hypothetical protein